MPNMIKIQRRVLLLTPTKEDNYVINRLHMGLTLLGSILTDAGHNVRVIDYAFLRSVSKYVHVSSIEETIREFQPDVIGISVFSYLYDECLSLIKRISTCSNSPIILGGPHFTIFPEDFSSDNRISYIVRGEAESIILDLVQSAKQEPIPVVINAPLPTPANIPAVNLEIAYGSEYLENYQIQLSRGCPYKCSFCNVHMIAGRKFRARDLETVIDQIVETKKRYPRINTVTITDDCPTFDQKRFKHFLYLLKRANINCTLFVDNVRADSVDDESLSLYKAAGGLNMCLGVESGDVEVFSRIHKGESLATIVEAAKKIRQHGLILGLCFVIGLPGDNFASHLNSMRLAKELRPTYIFWNMVVPWPGTEVARWYQIHGEVGEVRNFSTLIDPRVNFKEPICSSPAFSKEEMIKAWLMANMETHSYLASPENFLRLLQLTLRYRLYRSFLALLLGGFPTLLGRSFVPLSWRAAIRKRYPCLISRLHKVF